MPGKKTQNKAHSSKNHFSVEKDKVREEEEFLVFETQPRWYALRTYPGFEYAVAKSLEQKIENLGLQDRILEVFIPTRRVWKVDSKGRRKQKSEVVHSGYIYVYMLLDKEVGYLIQNTNYVSGIAGTGNVAVPLEEGYVENLKEKLLQESENNSVVTKSHYKIGDLVQVLEGAFKGMRGRICALDLDNNRVGVLLSIFDRETRVDLSVLDIEKLF